MSENRTLSQLLFFSKDVIDETATKAKAKFPIKEADLIDKCKVRKIKEADLIDKCKVRDINRNPRGP